MADATPVFTPEEQLKLRELENQVNGFTSFRNLAARSLYQGQDSILAGQLIQFLSDLITQSSNQAKQIQDTAKARSLEAAPEAKAQ